MAEYNINIDRVGDDLNEAYDFGYQSCMRDYHIKRSNEQQTNGDRIRRMSDEELAEWYWWMLKYVQGYTDSRCALLDWLRKEAEDG